MTSIVSAVTPLQVQTLAYDEAELLEWKQGNYDRLLRSSASPFLKEILVEKAKAKNPSRTSTWFFGEAFVAAHVGHEAGYYGSFKWLTSWPASGGASRYGKAYRAALREAFPSVTELPSKAPALHWVLDGKKPVPPDLWLVVNGQHRFIEVKLPKDSIRPTQIAGLALIATYLSRDADVSVWVYNLYPQGQQPTPISPEVQAMYSRFWSVCAAR